MAIQTRIINGSYTEIYVGGGNFITQGAPTNFHQFWTRKVLTPGESIEDFREVTASEKEALEASDAATKAAGLGIRTAQTPLYESIGAVFNDNTGYYELNSLKDLTEDDMRKIYSLRGLFERGFYYLRSTAVLNNAKIRTLPPLYIDRKGGASSIQEMFIDCSNLEEVIFINSGGSIAPYRNGIFNAKQAFLRCGKLHTVKGLVLTHESAIEGAFLGCAKLANLEITGLNRDLSLPNSPSLTPESLSFIIEQRYEAGKFDFQNQPASDFTLTLHPTAYARVTDELFALAAEKQITIART